MLNKCFMIFLVLLLLACAAGMKGFKEPSSDKTIMVLGNIVFENRYYNDQTEVIRKGINVAIVGKHDADNKDHAYWVTTDEQGYFCLADVPRGKYAIQGVKLYLGQGEVLTIANPLKHSSSFYQIQRREYVVFQADYFPIETDSRIYNLKMNHFWIDQATRSSAEVHHNVYERLENLSLIDGNKLTLAPIVPYFIEQHPQSAWVPVLKESIQ